MSLLATFLTMRRLLPALLAAGLVLGACGGDDDDDGDRAAVTSIPEEASTSTSTTTEPRTVAPDVIPQDESQITEEYVEQVLNELNGVSLEALLLARQDGGVDEASIELVEATNSPRRSRDEINDLIELSLGGFQGFRAQVRPVQTEVVAVLEGTKDCVFAEIRIDNSGYFEESVPLPANVRGFAKLLPASEAQVASGHNPTAWVVDATPATDDGSVPPDGCANA